jgi:hypothetical protein
MPARESAMRRRARVLMLAAILAAASGAVAGDARASGTGQLFATFRSWTLDTPGEGKTTVSQFLLPVSAKVPIRGATQLTVYGAAASSTLDPGGGSSGTLSGTSALSAQLSGRVAQGRVLLQTGVTLPSGTKDMTPGDLAVLRSVSLPLLGFGLRQYGRGFEWNGGASTALPLGGRMVGSIGAGYTWRGAYGFVRDAGDFQPAWDFATTAGLDLLPQTGSVAPLALDLTLRTFGTDQSDDRDLVHEGRQLELQLRGYTGAELGMQTRGVVRTVFQSSDRVYGVDSLGLADLDVQGGTGIFAHVDSSWPLRGQRAGLEAEWNHVDGSDVPARDGDTFGFGGQGWVTAGAGAFRGEALYLLGTLHGVQRDIDASGFAVSLAWTMGWGAR